MGAGRAVMGTARRWRLHRKEEAMGTAAGVGETECPKTWAGSGLKPPCPSWADGPAVGIGFSFFSVQATDGHLSTDGHRRSTASYADGRHLPTVVFAASHRGTLC